VAVNAFKQTIQLKPLRSNSSWNLSPGVTEELKKFKVNIYVHQLMHLFISPREY